MACDPNETGFCCKWTETDSEGVVTTMKQKVQMRVFYPQCPKINQQCSSLAGGFVSAITICNQQIF